MAPRTASLILSQSTHHLRELEFVQGRQGEAVAVHAQARKPLGTTSTSKATAVASARALAGQTSQDDQSVQHDSYFESAQSGPSLVLAPSPVRSFSRMFMADVAPPMYSERLSPATISVKL
jgi:hypothetical protein